MNGKIRYRLMIEGCSTEWVTDSTLERTCSDSRIRRMGLQYDGLEINEQLDLRECVLELSGMSIKIRSEYADAVFAHHPAVLGVLQSDIDYDDTLLPLGAALLDLFTVGDVIHLGTEACLVTAKVAGVSLQVTRCYWDTLAQGHYYSVGDNLQEVPIFNRPYSYEGRRVYLFKYEATDVSDGQRLFNNAIGSETLTTDNVIWRGVISRPPQLDNDGLTWILNAEPVTFVLEQEIAAVTERTFDIGGIYFHYKSAIGIELTYWVGETPYYQSAKLTGFYPDNSSLEEDVNTALETLRGFIPDPPEYIRLGNDGTTYYIVTKTDSSAQTNFNIVIISPLFGSLSSSWYIGYGTQKIPVPVLLAGEYIYTKRISTKETSEVFGGEKIGNRFEKELGSRQFIGTPLTSDIELEYRVFMTAESDATDYPMYRLFLSEYPGPILVAGATLLIKNSRPNQTEGDESYKTTAVVSAVGQDATYGVTYVDLVAPKSSTGYLALGPESSITIVRNYGSNSNLGLLLDSIIDQSVFANQGDTPFVTWSDINALSVTGLAFVLQAMWSFCFQNSAVLGDVVREHLKMSGYFPHLNSLGQLNFSPLNRLSNNDPNVITIDDSNIVTPYGSGGRWPKWTPASDGVVSVVEISQLYDPVEDSFNEDQKVVVRDIKSISTHKNRSRGVTKIEPKGVWDSNDGVPEDECVRIATQYLSYHSLDYDVIELDVSFSLFDSITCGTAVAVTCPFVPNVVDGTRGIANKRGTVIGRSWPLDPAAAGYGTLRIRINRDETYGYAPACRITGNSVYSGFTYTITVASNYFSATGDYDTAHFAVGDRIRVVGIEYSPSATVYERSGTVAAITSYTSMRVSLSAAFPASTLNLWDLEYDVDTGSLNSDQRYYCYVADATRLLYNGDIGRTLT